MERIRDSSSYGFFLFTLKRSVACQPHRLCEFWKQTLCGTTIVVPSSLVAMRESLAIMFGLHKKNFKRNEVTLFEAWWSVNLCHLHAYYSSNEKFYQWDIAIFVMANQGAGFKKPVKMLQPWIHQWPHLLLCRVHLMTLCLPVATFKVSSSGILFHCCLPSATSSEILHFAINLSLI